MQFTSTAIDGVYIVELQEHGDDRGFFARSYCEREFKEVGLTVPGVQCNVSFNRHKGTVRGLHFQNPPAAESKLVRCTRGRIVDVAVDMRADSKTRYQHVMVELTAENRKALYVPEGFAHGFQTLEDETEVFYQVTAFYSPEHEGGLRYNDPRLGIAWPAEVTTISDKDSDWVLIDNGPPPTRG